jgi:hypothetical protein
MTVLITFRECTLLRSREMLVVSASNEKLRALAFRVDRHEWCESGRGAGIWRGFIACRRPAGPNGWCFRVKGWDPGRDLERRELDQIFVYC